MSCFAVAAQLRCLAALCLLWLPGALKHSNTQDPPAVRIVGDTLQACVSSLQTALHVAASVDAVASEDALLIAHSAAEALVTLTHVAMAHMPEPLQLAVPALRQSDAARQLRECAVQLAITPAAPSAGGATALSRSVWTAFVDVFIVWVAQSERRPDWQAVQPAFTDVVAPVVHAWWQLHAALFRDDSMQWQQAEGSLRAACGFASTLCTALGQRARDARACAAASLRSMLQPAIQLLQIANARGESSCAEPLTDLMAVACSTMVGELGHDFASRVISASHVSKPGACAVLVAEQLPLLPWRRRHTDKPACRAAKVQGQLCPRL
jgi:hypothetical protein